MFTEIKTEEINKLKKLQGEEINKIKILLANEVTKKFVMSEEKSKIAEQEAKKFL